MMTTKDILIAARKLIEKPEKWCKGAYRTEAGEKHCAAGAITDAGCSDGIHIQEARETYRAAAGLPPMSMVSAWNDAPERTHSEVLAAFDRAIAACGQEGE